MEARISAEASVNFPPHEWTQVAGAPKVMRAVRYQKLHQKWMDTLCIDRINLDEGVVLVASDTVARVPGRKEQWVQQVRPTGTQGTRPNGVTLAYLFSHDDVVQQGLPTREVMERAFRKDALSVLTSGYEKQGVGPELMRRFEPHEVTSADNWKPSGAPQKTIPSGARHGAEVPAGGSGKEWIDRGKKNRIAAPSINRRAMLVTGVGIGAVLVGYAAWRMLNQTQTRNDRAR